MDLDPAFIRDGLITFILLIASIAFHEWGHAVVADVLGDDTPRAEGRVTLNPLSHLDKIGTVFVPIVNIFVFGGALPFIGWGKPVMTNPSNLKNRWRDDILISAAGPAANLLLALVAIVVGSLVVVAQPRLGELTRGLVVMNVGLAVFNLLPIPPLDCAFVLRRVVGMSEQTFSSLSRWSGLIILVVVNVAVTERLIVRGVELACSPYARISSAINPIASLLIFPR
jgi:Zn-dependent protease